MNIDHEEYPASWSRFSFAEFMQSVQSAAWDRDADVTAGNLLYYVSEPRTRQVDMFREVLHVNGADCAREDLVCTMQKMAALAKQGIPGRVDLIQQFEEELSYYEEHQELAPREPGVNMPKEPAPPKTPDRLKSDK